MGARILVIGATGMLGRPVAKRLRADGFPVRVLSRSPETARELLGSGFEHVGGDVGDPAALEAALDGCRGVHVSLRGRTPAELLRTEIEGTRRIAEAARAAGVERLTYLSGAGIEAADPALLPVRVKQQAEAAIQASGVRYTILRATHFMESLDLFVRGDKAVILGRQPLRFHYLAAADFAAQVSAIFQTGVAEDRALTLLGPEPFTMAEALARYIALFRPDLRLTMAPRIIPRLIASLTGDEELSLIATLFGAFPRIPETGDRDEADRLVGPAATTLDTWLQERRTAAA